jgi:hypothetical protein
MEPIGVLGEPTGHLFGLARTVLTEWASQHSREYQSVGPWCVLNYNSPVVPPSRRYSEIRIPLNPMPSIVRSSGSPSHLNDRLMGDGGPRL